MNRKRKYIVSIVGITILYLFLFCTEVIDRVEQGYGLWKTYNERKDSFIDSRKLSEKKNDLLRKKARLAASLTGGDRSFEQSQTGVVDFINVSAKKSNIQFESITPVMAQDSGELKQVDVKINFSSDFHHVGYFLNNVESGPIIFRFKSLEVTAQPTISNTLEIKAEAIAFILPKQLHLR